MIPEFFEDREIFITGGSGVVGKALVDKILRSCNVRKIYILLRPKKGENVEQRFQTFKKSMIFRRLHKEKPQELDEKITVVHGDVGESLLGLTPEYRKLMENVSIVYHAAATVRFDEPLRHAIKLNVGGTFEALKFAETLKHLVLFMHVSTFYSNPYLKFVEPKLYESPMNWKFCLELSRQKDLPDELLDTLTKKLIVGFPNTYCFTKNLAESLVNVYRNKFPVCIYRPSIIIFAFEDPEPGYTATMTGAMGLMAVNAAGIMKTIYLGQDQRIDNVSQDLVVNSILYYTHKAEYIYTHCRPTEAPVFHTSSRTHYESTFQEFLAQMEVSCTEAPLEKSLWVPSMYCTDNRLLYVFLVLLLQILPSILVDLLLLLCGRKAVLMKAQRTLWITLQTLQPFLFNFYGSSGCSYAKEMIEDLDGTEFIMDALKYGHKKSYADKNIRYMLYGIRECLFKQNPKTLPRSRTIMRAKMFFFKILQIFLIYKACQRIIGMLCGCYF